MTKHCTYHQTPGLPISVRRQRYLGSTSTSGWSPAEVHGSCFCALAYDLSHMLDLILTSEKATNVRHIETSFFLVAYGKRFTSNTESLPLLRPAAVPTET